jgi:hypothetical protein
MKGRSRVWRLHRSWTVAAPLCLGFVMLAPGAAAQEVAGPDADDQIVLCPSNDRVIPRTQRTRNGDLMVTKADFRPFPKSAATIESGQRQILWVRAEALIPGQPHYS